MVNINGKDWEKLQAEDIKEYLATGEENIFFEYKIEKVSSDHLAKEISAFANTYGGYIFLGVSNDGKIEGCNSWDEEKITNVIYDHITPIPIFDVKSFEISKNKIFVIKIEEGPLPPYITSEGQICERISSSSRKLNTKQTKQTTEINNFDTIKHSEQLTRLFNKRESQEKKTANRIELPPMLLDKLPDNLCGYLDFGFEVANSKPTVLEQKWFDFDFSPVSNYLHNGFSIAKVGNQLNITLGTIRAPQNIQYISGLHNFIEIMQDGSVRGRIILTCNNKFQVDLENILLCYGHFKEVYKLIFGPDFYSNFIYARRYEKLTVLKQFSTFYSKFDKGEILKDYYRQHREKYGDTLIINGNRTPSNGYLIIDKRFMQDKAFEQNNDTLLELLFCSSYINLGYIDSPKH